MGRSGYTSLSIEEKQYARIRRKFDQVVDTDLTFTQWHTEVFENNLFKIEFLNNTFPHLKLIKVTEKSMIIEDTKKDEIIKVTVKGKKMESSIEGDEYILFAAMHPEFKV